MSELEVTASAQGSAAAATVPANGPIASLKDAKWVRITLSTGSQKSGVFEVDARPREGAAGNCIYVLPGALGLSYGESKEAVALPVSRWTYRRSQLRSPTGCLLLLTLIAAIVPATIDLSLAVGKSVFVWLWLEPKTLAVLGVVSLVCKLFTAVFAFLLALWFKKP